MKEVIDMTKSAISPPEGKILEEKMADAWDCPKCGAKGINAKGNLLVACDDGTEKFVDSGEVSVRGLYGYV